jgi:hypothetical protein
VHPLPDDSGCPERGRVSSNVSGTAVFSGDSPRLIFPPGNVHGGFPARRLPTGTPRPLVTIVKATAGRAGSLTKSVTPSILVGYGADETDDEGSALVIGSEHYQEAERLVAPSSSSTAADRLILDGETDRNIRDILARQMTTSPQATRSVRMSGDLIGEITNFSTAYRYPQGPGKVVHAV